MLLSVDVGNTQTTIGMFERRELEQHWRISSQPDRTADELALIIQGLLTQVGLSFQRQITGVVISSVVPRMTQAMREMTERYFRFPAVIVEPGVKTGMPILTDNPKEVGADRIVNSVAAFELYGGPCIVVDFGTATTFDAVSVKGEYLGGSIAPGVEISTNALVNAGAQLRRVEYIPPRSVIGKTTVEAIQSGVLYGFAGQVDAIVERMAKELGGKVEVVATGGLAPVIMPETVTIDHHEPWLTLLGLRTIYDRNTATDDE
ncbi:MAG TPA: type III pantothenate kinase [Actinomycetota bacterium]|nr:type III pantothenate kinase [Actinomycetota bacterium]